MHVAAREPGRRGRWVATALAAFFVGAACAGAATEAPPANALIGGNGRFVVFRSWAPDLVRGDTNKVDDVFVRDRLKRTTARVSLSTSGEQGNRGSFRASVSTDGRFVAFESYSTNLVPGDTNGRMDVFVRDRVAGTTERVSVGVGDAQATDDCLNPAISADGRNVAFASVARLVAEDTNRFVDVFVRDRVAGTTERVSVTADGSQASGDYSVSMSADGRLVAFASLSPNLDPGRMNGATNVFVRDRVKETTERISLASDGTPSSVRSMSNDPALSADGRAVAFTSDADNLVPGDTNGKADTFVHDRVRGTTERVSVGAGGVEGTAPAEAPSVSADGRFVAFTSSAPNLVPGDTNRRPDVFVHDRVRGVTERVSVTWKGAQASGYSHSPAVSADGRSIAFTSATRLTAARTPADAVFLRDRVRRTTELVSVPRG